MFAAGLADLESGVLLALGAAFVAGCLWLARNGFVSAVTKEFAPLKDKLEQHMNAEEDGRDEINDKLDAIKDQFDQNQLDHAAFEERIRRLENL